MSNSLYLSGKPSRKAPAFHVYINGKKNADCAVLSVGRYCNFQRPDSATFVFTKRWKSQSGGNYRPLSNYSLQQVNLHDIVANDTCEIVMQSAEGGSVEVIHFGRITAVNAECGQRGETITYTSRLDKHMFSSGGHGEYAITGFLRGTDGTPELSNRVDVYPPVPHVTFNPVHDGEVKPNMLHTADGTKLTHVMCYPRGREAYSAFEKLKFWKLPDIAYWLCRVWFGDPFDPNGFSVPSYDDLKKVLSGEDLVRNLRIPMDSFPDAMNSLLEPFGYTWHVHHEKRGQRSIALNKRQPQAGGIILQMQKYGETLDTGKTTVSSFSFNYDLSDKSCTHAYVVHEPAVVEVTVELYPAWDPKYDGYREDQLSRDAVEDDLELQRVWRDWVLNENRQYDGRLKRRGMMPIDFDFTRIFKKVMPDDAITSRALRRRRPLGRMLTLDENGSPLGDHHGGVYVEYWLQEFGDRSDHANWRPISELGTSVAHVTLKRLSHECGISFVSGDKPPKDLIDHAWSQADSDLNGWESKFKIRVTGTVTADLRSHSVQSQPTFLRAFKPLVVHAGDRYRRRFIHPDSWFYGDTDKKNEAADDALAADLYARHLAESWSSAACNGSITLPALDAVKTHRMLGNSCFGIAWRNIFTKTSHPSKKTKNYPTIVSIEYDVQGQKLKLGLDSLRRAAR